MTKNNNFIEEVEKEFDSFMINEYGQWKIGRVEAKQFISQKLQQAQIKAREELKKEIVKMIEEEDMIEEGDYSAKYISIMLTDLISKIKNI